MSLDANSLCDDKDEFKNSWLGSRDLRQDIHHSQTIWAHDLMNNFRTR
jgi:hypothetical protein